MQEAQDEPEALRTWREAFDERDRAIRAHPQYPTLFRKVARSEAAMLHPIEHHYVRRNHDTALIDDRWGNARIWFLHWRKSLPRHGEYGPGEPLRDAWDFAATLVPDLFPEPWPSEGDMTAAVYGAARSDVWGRRDMRRAVNAG